MPMPLPVKATMAAISPQPDIATRTFLDSETEGGTLNRACKLQKIIEEIL
jgi:hypothetical protein